MFEPTPPTQLLLWRMCKIRASIKPLKHFAKLHNFMTSDDYQITALFYQDTCCPWAPLAAVSLSFVSVSPAVVIGGWGLQTQKERSLKGPRTCVVVLVHTWLLTLSHPRAEPPGLQLAHVVQKKKISLITPIFAEWTPLNHPRWPHIFVLRQHLFTSGTFECCFVLNTSFMRLTQRSSLTTLLS